MVDTPNITLIKPCESERGKHVKCLLSFYEGDQHNHLSSSWEGAARDPGMSYLQERLSPSGFVPVNAIPYGRRKPDAAIPLPRQIVARFTEMLFGHGRNPEILAPSDQKSQKYIRAFFDEAQMWDVLMEARDIAGSCGSVAIASSVMGGRPCAEVLSPQDLFVREWATAPGWIPTEVVEQKLVTETVEDPEKGLVERRYWTTRIWTDDLLVSYADVEEDDDEYEPGTPLEVIEAVPHGAGRCPVVWYQNTRNTKSSDGTPDCDGVWHLCDVLDRLWSHVAKAAKANADPMLVLKEDERYLKKNPIVRKGSGSALPLSPTGDAKYLEINGSSIEMAMKMAEAIRQEILKTAECIIPDPAMAGAYRSSDAMMLVWRGMEAKANRLRVPVGEVIKQLSDVAMSFGRKLGVKSSGTSGVVLHPVITKKGEEVTVEPHEVGTAEVVELKWPPYWPPTPEQIKDITSAFSEATGGAKLVSRETAVTHVSSYLGVDPEEEERRIGEDEAGDKAEMDSLIEAAKKAPPVEQGAPKDQEPDGVETEEG